jgi:DNA-binding transcriptional regulator YdaS (Cro superfamily)
MDDSGNWYLNLVIRKAGNQRQLARFLWVSEASVTVWCQKGYIPAHHAARIEAEWGIDRRQLASKDTLWPEDGMNAMRDRLSECENIIRKEGIDRAGATK